LLDLHDAGGRIALGKDLRRGLLSHHDGGNLVREVDSKDTAAIGQVLRRRGHCSLRCLPADGEAKTQAGSIVAHQASTKTPAIAIRLAAAKQGCAILNSPVAARRANLIRYANRAI